ncbi:MAG: mannose-1-phosphate guanylyltransferase [marine bacterium B5-7]|nr:MAG: mannose-1-phosphate guanylyltransferase [marine bacterium B5-7]
MMDAFILAAGRGERLRPLTDITPKPLVKVAGKPLIVHHILNLREAGFSRIIINVSWLAEKIIDALGDGSRFGVSLVYSREPGSPLETAGGIINALPLIKSERFVAVNADIWCDPPFDQVLVIPGEQAGLLLVENPAHHSRGDYGLEDNWLVWPDQSSNVLTFSGISWFSRNLFENRPKKILPLRDVIAETIDRGTVGGRIFAGRWIDIGTLERLKEAERITCGDVTPR